MAGPASNSAPYEPDLSNWLLCFAIGDAYCFCAEFVEPDHPVVAEALKFQRYVEHPIWGTQVREQGPGAPIYAGQYTDDTQMTIAVAEAFLSGRVSTFELADAFVSTFRRDPRRGYSAGLQTLLDEVRDGQELLTRLHGRNGSEKNGAAMRSLVYGFASSHAQVAQLSGIGARITHDTPAGVSSAFAMALMAHYAIWDPERPFAQYGEALALARPDGFHGDWNTLPRESRVVGATFAPAETESLGWRTVRAVLHVLRKLEEEWPASNRERPNFELGDTLLRDAMRLVIQMGGDTDTVGALVCGILGLRGAQPEGWMVDGLEAYGQKSRDPHWGAQYGARYLQNLGQRLAAMLPKKEAAASKARSMGGAWGEVK